MKRQREKEYSKRLTTTIRNFFFLHVLLSLGVVLVMATLMLFIADLQDTFAQVTGFLLSLFSACMPIYMGVILAYCGKSGYENGLKIKKGLKQEETETDETSSEG